MLKNIFLKDIEDQFLINTNAKECAAIFVPDKNGKGTIRIYYSTGDDQSIIKSSITNYTSLCNIEYIKIPFIPLHPTSAKVHYSKLSYDNSKSKPEENAYTLLDGIHIKSWHALLTKPQLSY